MKVNFEKYQGTGNDFIMIDQRENKYLDHYDQQVIEKLCDRRFGIGGDGLILLENSEKNDFKMVYFNADGRQSTMCGNGGRCIVQFAHSLGLIEKSTTFDAVDGAHEAIVNDDKTVSLHMMDVHHVIPLDNNTYLLNTGSPHYVTFCDVLPSDIKVAGCTIRYSPTYIKDGINVNFVKSSDDMLEIATYERGVEDETFSCGTGVTAAAIAFALKNKLTGISELQLITKGGLLKVKFNHQPFCHFSDIWLIGPAIRTFKGEFVFDN